MSICSTSAGPGFRLPPLFGHQGLDNSPRDRLLQLGLSADLSDGRNDPAQLAGGHVVACTQKTGLSVKGLQRELGLGQLQDRLADAAKAAAGDGRVGREKLSGTLEIDETYVGGDERHLRGRKLVGKALVAVAVELEGRKMGRVRLRHVPSASGANLLPFVIDWVEKGSSIHSDG